MRLSSNLLFFLAFTFFFFIFMLDFPLDPFISTCCLILLLMLTIILIFAFILLWSHDPSIDYHKQYVQNNLPRRNKRPISYKNFQTQEERNDRIMMEMDLENKQKKMKEKRKFKSMFYDRLVKNYSDDDSDDDALSSISSIDESPQPFVVYYPYSKQGIELGNIKWAEEVLEEYFQEDQSVETLVSKIRDTVFNLYHQYDEEQAEIFQELQGVANTIFGYNFPQYQYHDRNILYRQMARLCKQNKVSTACLHSLPTDIATYFSATTPAQIDSIPKTLNEKNIQNFTQLSNTLSKLKYKRFLEADSKLDLLEFIVVYLNRHLFVWTPLVLVVTHRIICAKRYDEESEEQMVYFIQGKDFCYVSNQQGNNAYNLEETILLAILRSKDYQKRPEVMSIFLEELPKLQLKL